MDEFVQVVRDGPAAGIGDAVVLEYSRREKTRQRAQLESGEEIAIKLPRGTVMRGGDCLRTAHGRTVRVVSGREQVSTVYASAADVLARVAYHLGNRHVWLQVGPGWVRYLADHVLDDMVRGFGLEPAAEVAAFEPEGGAYSSHGHSHTGGSGGVGHEH